MRITFRWLSLIRSFQKKDANTVSSELLQKGIENNSRKYSETYKLLNEYDKTSPRKPEDLARPKVVQDFIRFSS